MSDVNFAVLYFASGTLFGILLILFAVILTAKYSGLLDDDEDDDDTDGGDEEKARNRI